MPYNRLRNNLLGHLAQERRGFQWGRRSVRDHTTTTYNEIIKNNS